MSKVVLIDSCGCGFSVLHHILEWGGEHEYTYFADGEKNPFGLRKKDEILKIANNWFEYFTIIEPHDLIILACHTASSVLKEDVDRLSSEYNIPVITLYDAMQVAIKNRSDLIKDKVVGLIGTKLTIESKIYTEMILESNPSQLIEIIATYTERVIARGLLGTKKGHTIIINELIPFADKGIETIVLGCTCLPIISSKIENTLNVVKIIDPGKEVLNLMKDGTNQEEKINLKDIRFIYTGDEDEWRNNINKIAKEVFDESVKLEKIILRSDIT